LELFLALALLPSGYDKPMKPARKGLYRGNADKYKKKIVLEAHGLTYFC
jgi:hypothetical protein